MTWKLCGHNCGTNPTPAQNPEAPYDPKIPGLNVRRRRPRRNMRTLNASRDWTADVASALDNPRFTQSPMRDRGHRKQRWLALCQHTLIPGKGDTPSMTVTQHPWTTPKTMREWAANVIKREQNGGMPNMLRMDLWNGVTPDEAIETACDLENDRSLHPRIAYIDRVMYIE